MAKKLSKKKAAIMLHEGMIRGKKITDKQRRYFGHIANAQDGLSLIDPNTLTASTKTNGGIKRTELPVDPKSGKRARIIANSIYPEFREEYERTKAKYAEHYPGGVEFVEATGYDELQNAFGNIKSDEDLIMMAHYNKDAMYRVPVSDPEYQTLDAPKGKTIAGLFGDLQGRGYKGNCYLGICDGEETAKSLQGAGVNIPMFSTPEGKKWYGSNPASRGNFEDFFFGVGQLDSGLTPPDPQAFTPKIGQDYLMNISPRQQELMNRRKSGTPVKEVKPLKQGGKLSKYTPGGIVEKLGGVSGIANTATSLIQGFQMLKQEKENKKKAEQFLQLSNIVGQAASLRPDMPKRKYVRPEDMIIDPNQLYPTYGTGTNFLAKNGKKLPSYEKGGWLTDITGEGNEGTAGSMLGSLFGGGGGQQTGAGKIGSTLGGVAGSFLGPVGGAVGSFIGGTIGGAIGGNEQKETERRQRQAISQLQSAAFQQGSKNIQEQYSAFMEKGGKIPSYNLGGELQVYDGEAETISQNPYLPNGGETVMFKGPSHAEGGMNIKYGKTPVEVEGGEPAVKLKHGGKGQENLIIYGDMKIPSYGVSELDDPKAKGKKFKTYVKELSKIEDKQNDVVDKGIKIVNSTPLVDSFDKLKFSSGKAMVEGGNMKLKDIARKKQIAANIQNAILDTADEFGLKSEELAKGNIRKAKKGAKIKGYEHGAGVPPNRPPDTDEIYPGGPFAHQTDYAPMREDAFAESVATPAEKPDWMTIFNSVLPNLRPSNQLALDPSQLSGEMFSLATNQLEPVQAQTYQPLLESVSDISLQDQLNANQADFNALKRLTANNPAAQAALAAQKYGANSAVLGEQFRLNQAQKMGTFNRNRATLNDATLKNLAILDQQYVRQAGAKSATKATAQAALSSIAEKMARNKLENRTLGVYENLYNYRFGPRGQAFNLNPLAQFNIPEAGGQLPIYDDQGNITGYRQTQSVRRDKYGIPTGSTDTKTTTTKTTKRNGGIVKAIKNL